MKSFRDIIGDNQPTASVLKGAMAALTVEAANEILSDLFGQVVAEYAEAVYIKNRILHIKVKGSAAAAEIKMSGDKIMAEIGKKFGNEAVKEVRIII